MLRPYQQEVARAVLESIQEKKGLTFAVEIARQGGKNELSAQLELLLLTMHMARGGSGIKCSPTFKPQTVISMMRLKERLDDFGFGGIWTTEMGYIVRLGAARQIFLSAEESSSVVGHTADILLEVDESQDVDREKYSKEFRPMGSSSNVTTVHYGTTWDDSTLLEETKNIAIELEKKDGIRRHFRYDWQQVAAHNHDYRAFVEAERQRLGEDHPLFRTQYALLPIHGGGGFLTATQIGKMAGRHDRLAGPRPGRTYVAGIDLAGEAEVLEEEMLVRPGRDATVITVAEVDTGGKDSAGLQPVIRIVEHYCWVGRKHTLLLDRITELMKDIWDCSRVVVDATGAGEPIASFLRQRLGSRVVSFKFTQRSKSEAGFELLAAVNSGRLKLYRQDGSDDYQSLMQELKRAKSIYRPNQTLGFYVDPSEGHDDYLISLALVVQAAGRHVARRAVGQVQD